MADPVELAWEAGMKKKDWERAQELNEIALREEERRYQRERSDAIADFNRQNSYNSPEQQMNRLRQAGVNPHLAFGKGGESTGAMIRSSSSHQPDLKMTTAGGPIKGGNQILEFAQLQQIQAQTDQTSQVTQNLKVDQALKILGLAGKSTENANALIDYNVKSKTASAAIKKLWNDADLSGLDYAHKMNQFNLDEQNAIQHNKDMVLKYDREKIGLQKDKKDVEIKQQILDTGDIENKTRLINQLFLQHGLDGNDPYYLKTLVKELQAAKNMAEINSIIYKAQQKRKYQ
jgi:hypothetical protein